MAPSEVLSAILHYKKNIEKICDTPERAIKYEERLLHCIHKLYKLPVNITHLQETGVGKTVNSLRKIQGKKGLGDAAKALVAKWKTMVMLQDAEDRRRREVAQLSSNAEDIRRIKLIRDAEKSHARKTEDSQKPREISHSDKSKKKSESKNIKFESLHDGRERKRKHSDEGKSSSDDDCGDRYHSDAKKRSRNSYEEEKAKSVMEIEKYSPQYVEPRSYEEPKSKERKKEKTEEKHRSRSEKHKSSEKSDKISEPKSKHSNSSSSSEKSDEKREPKLKHSNTSNVWDYSEKLDKKRESQLKHSNSSSSSSSSSSSEKSDERSEPKSKHSNSSNTSTSSRSSSSSEKSDKKSESISKHLSSSEKSDKKSESISKHLSSSEKSDKKSESKPKPSNSSSVWDYSEKLDKKSESIPKHLSSSEKSDKKSESISKHLSSSEKSDKKSESISKHLSSSEKSDKKSEPKSEHTNSSSIRGHSQKLDKKSEAKHSISSNSSSKSKYKPVKHESNHISHEKSEARKSKVSTNVNQDEEGGIDCHSGASFADALGPMIVKKAKKKFSQSVSVSQTDPPSEKVTNEKKPKNQIDITRPPSEPLEPDLISTLPVPTPHYKPSQKNNISLQEASRRRIQAEEDALNSIISNKNQRTKVYSGVKGGLPYVPTLYEFCCRVLQQHLDAIEYTGGIPYSLLKPILDAASPAQLFQFEHFNPYVIEETDHLWEFHVRKEFRDKSRQEFESWRDMYLRCMDEREEKYKAVTANIQKSIERSAPVRKAKLAYIDMAKPPRNILRKQIKNGLHKPEAARLLGKNNPEAVKVPAPKQLTAKEPPTIKSKPKIAPLMQKTLKCIRMTRFKR